MADVADPTLTRDGNEVTNNNNNEDRGNPNGGSDSDVTMRSGKSPSRPSDEGTEGENSTTHSTPLFSLKTVRKLEDVHHWAMEDELAQKLFNKYGYQHFPDTDVVEALGQNDPPSRPSRPQAGQLCFKHSENEEAGQHD